MSTSSEKTPGQPSRGAVGWKTVSIFVSSTFDDMHAERDYLVKEVFPRLASARHARRSLFRMLMQFNARAAASVGESWSCAVAHGLHPTRQKQGGVA
jgi:hypothetical protein